MLSLQEISDRMEIAELLARYSAAIDGRAWDDLDALFTPDAVIDYTEMGGIRGSLAEQKSFLVSVMPSFAGFQHLTATSTFDIDGDTARVRTICFNPMVVTDERHVLFCGLWYRDILVRTADGWRIRERHEDRGWSLDLRA
ncbi:MAG: hypothetical protein JWO88_612 [Frankiales bacterium]|nr:hypothetical protein [Frankiales bacterium]